MPFHARKEFALASLPDHVYVVVLAGGSGTRFWPKSRHLSPKQLCEIGSADKSMLAVTLDRLDEFVPVSRRLVVTHRDQRDATLANIAGRAATVLGEPAARNTANALALAALEIEARHQGTKPAVMISLHADHVIKNVPEFLRDLEAAVRVAECDRLCLLGVVPKYPETGFGYIEQGESLEVTTTPKPVWNVASFREKPDLSTAKQFVGSGKFFWNAGLFVWRTRVILDELRERLPLTVKALESARSSNGFTNEAKLAAAYNELPKVSIDTAVLEVSKRVAVIATDFGWQDVGSWDALSQCFPTDKEGNLVYGDALLIDSKNTTVDTDGTFVACVGVEDMIVVNAKGAILVCPKNRAQDVKLIVEELQRRQRNELL